jgi:hypothetical protein
MRKRERKFWKTLACAGLCGALAVSSAMTSFAFYQEPASKKGLLISKQELFDDILELGVDQVVCNLASYQNVNAFDPLARDCRENGVTLTMILLNNFGARNPDLMPVSEPVEGVGNYAFNTETPEGEEAVREYARTVANHYSNSVSNWVIGNEVNDAEFWDYNGVMDMDAHAAGYAKTFRIFYEEIKAANPEARVFIPFDMRWAATDRHAGRYAVRDYLPKLNALLKDTDYGIAWHAYPVHFFTKPEFLDDDGISFDLNTPNINLKNINVLTDYMQGEDMLAPDGSVRKLILTEQGFTSACENGEERQSEAIKAAYEIVKANPYIDGFYLSRHVDAKSQEDAGGAFGLWTRDPNASQDEVPLAKKKAWYTYQALE